jgi:hypothetical protein
MKTTYGLFDDLVKLILSDLEVAEKPGDTEDTAIKYRHIALKIKKAQKIIDEFPRLSGDNTTRIAETLLSYCDYYYRYLYFVGGIRKSTNNSNYYKGRADISKKYIDEWSEKIKTIDLIVKPANTIEDPHSVD